MNEHYGAALGFRSLSSSWPGQQSWQRHRLDPGNECRGDDREWGEMRIKIPDVIPAFIAGIQRDLSTNAECTFCPAQAQL